MLFVVDGVVVVVVVDGEDKKKKGTVRGYEGISEGQNTDTVHYLQI